MRIRSRWLTWVLAWLAVTVVRLLFASCRMVYHAPERRLRLDAAADAAERFVYCVWHDGLLIPTFAPPKRLRVCACCLVSQHQDGGYLAAAMSLLGYSTVRGSTNRGGAQAVKQLLTDTAGKHIVITPDGPRGPRRIVKPGAVYLASQTGRRIVVGAFACQRSWRIQGSWTDALFPQPLTTVHLLTSAPISIPPELSRDELNQHVAVVQQALDQLQDAAERHVGNPPAAEPLRTAA